MINFIIPPQMASERMQMTFRTISTVSFENAENPEDIFTNANCFPSPQRTYVRGLGRQTCQISKLHIYGGNADSFNGVLGEEKRYLVVNHFSI
jgi:hypothetical protein